MSILLRKFWHFTKMAVHFTQKERTSHSGGSGISPRGLGISPKRNEHFTQEILAFHQEDWAFHPNEMSISLRRFWHFTKRTGHFTQTEWAFHSVGSGISPRGMGFHPKRMSISLMTGQRGEKGAAASVADTYMHRQIELFLNARYHDCNLQLFSRSSRIISIITYYHDCHVLSRLSRLSRIILVNSCYHCLQMYGDSTGYQWYS